MRSLVCTLFTCLLSAVFAFEAPEIVSHRGESADRPENTMAAFRLAFERGVDGVECDVLCTKDGVPVIIHDGTTGRTAGDVNLTISSSTWNQLKDVSVGAFGSWIGTEWENEKIPRLADYLALLSLNAKTQCVVELKNGANNLVANVVTAVKAQPLATKERVVFISFSADLVRAVREALPGYDAWLILSKGTYSGSDLISRIEACGATGIDVNYESTFSAADVAAVNAKGYKFSVWTCDKKESAIALAEKGVDSVTTNRGGEMKEYFAEKEEYFSVKFDSRFPSGLTRMDAGAYVQTGLVGHFDGISNAGAALAHDPAARVWKNLAGGPDAALVGDGGAWTADGKGFSFDGSSVYARLNDPGIDLNHLGATIQVASDINCSQQPSGRSVYPAIFYSSHDDDFGIYIDNNNTKGEKSDVLRMKSDPYGAGTRPTITSWNGKYFTAIFSNDPLSWYLYEGVERGSGTSRTGTRDRGAYRFSWGGSARETANRYSKGTYYSVRMYNRVLSDDEVAWNRLVDEIRFRETYPCGYVQVESNVKGLEGVEKSGTYYVNGTHTFSAAEATDASGRIWEPVGYKLERYDTAAWKLVGEYAGASCLAENSEAFSAVRITWNWRLKQGVKKYDADDYVAAGQLLNFDGIRNAGLGAAHDSAASVWRNLGSLGAACDATKRATATNLRPEAADGEWEAKGYFFRSKEVFDVNAKVGLGYSATVQVVSDHDCVKQDALYSGSTIRWPHFFGCTDAADWFNVYVNVDGTQSGDLVYFKGYNRWKACIYWDGRFANGIYDAYGKHAVLMYGSSPTGDLHTEEKSPMNAYGSLGSHTYAIGTGSNSDQNRANRLLYGIVHAVRVYDRVLAEGEFRHNREVDEARFFGNLWGTTETDLVQVRSDVEGAVTVDDGVWMLRGTATRTFTAPETLAITNRSGLVMHYSCAGYRIEEMDASKGKWKSAEAVVGGGCSVTLAGGDKSANRRLTWLWTATDGIRTAGDYGVSDYVRHGLVAHFDGIRNFSAARDHMPSLAARDADAANRFWRNLAPGGGPALRFWSKGEYSGNGGWTGGNGFKFDGKVYGRMVSPVALDKYATMQFVTDVAVEELNNAARCYPALIHAADDDNLAVYLQTGTRNMRLKSQYPGNNKPEVSAWDGKYLTAMLAEGYYYLFAGYALPSSGSERVARGTAQAVPARRFTIGGSPYAYGSTTGEDQRAFEGVVNSVRMYDRCLTDAEMAQNRKVDDIRFRNNFSRYANLTVVNGPVGATDVRGSSSIADGEYEVFGSVTFTASDVVVGGCRYSPLCTIETKDGEEWTNPVSSRLKTCTVSPGDMPIRLTWKWTVSGMRIYVR